MQTKSKLKNIVVIDICTNRRYIQQLANSLEIFEKNKIQLFTKNIFDIFLVNSSDYSQPFWEYLELTLGDDLNKFDLTYIEIIAEVLIECMYDTFKNATGIEAGYDVVDVTTNIGVFKIRDEEDVCLY